MADTSSSDSSAENKLSSSINLVRSSHSWTEADSAAGFVLRYLTPMRRKLSEIMGSSREADESLKLLLAHLVTAGFGDHKRGKLRDFLVRGIRSCAKARMAEVPEDQRRDLNLDDVKLDSKTWLQCWRDCLLERAWRALERHEHSKSEVPVYTVLKAATSSPNASTAELAESIRTKQSRNGNTSIRDAKSVTIDVATIEKTLPAARALFAQLIADEVVETLENPSAADVKKEINTLGLGRAFDGMNV